MDRKQTARTAAAAIQAAVAAGDQPEAYRAYTTYINAGATDAAFSARVRQMGNRGLRVRWGTEEIEVG